jgi:hypothetical protein
VQVEFGIDDITAGGGGGGSNCLGDGCVAGGEGGDDGPSYGGTCVVGSYFTSSGKPNRTRYLFIRLLNHIHSPSRHHSLFFSLKVPTVTTQATPNQEALCK